MKLCNKSLVMEILTMRLNVKKTLRMDGMTEIVRPICPLGRNYIQPHRKGRKTTDLDRWTEKDYNNCVEEYYTSRCRECPQ